MILEKIENLGIVPVITIENSEKAIHVAEALSLGEIPAIEITFRTESAIKSISKITAKYPNMLIGAGTVLTTEQVDKAIDAGSKFIVTPGFNPKVVEYALKKGIEILPGANNPSSIETAIEMGIKTVKFFPAESSGGLAAIKALSGPYNMLKFIPTGGITLENLASYLSFPKVAACGSSFMVTKEMIDNDEYETITKLSLEAVKKVHNFEFLHMGISTTDENEARRDAIMLGSLFNMDIRKAPTSYYIGNFIEIMKGPNMNHLGLSVNNVERTVAYLKNKGINIVESSKKYDNGVLTLVYLENEVAGHKVHIKKN